MKIFLNGKFSYSLTFLYHWIILSFIWTGLENIFYGHTVPSSEDSIIQTILVSYITYILGKDSTCNN